MTRMARRPDMPPEAAPDAHDDAAEELEQGRIPNEAVIWAFRFFAGREPGHLAELTFHKTYANFEGLRRAFIRSPEIDAYRQSLSGRSNTIGVPLFLLRPPADPAIPWRFEPPSLAEPVSQFSTASQFEEPAYAAIMGAMALAPRAVRPRWEQAWIVAMLARAGLLEAGRKGLGIAVAKDRIPALLASRGVEMLLTTSRPGWHEAAGRPGRILRELFVPEIAPSPVMQANISFAGLATEELARLPSSGFDFCWSIGQPSLLGSTEAALDFLEASLVPLKPGGLALHCFAVNLTSSEQTVAAPGLVLLRRADLEALATRLMAQGHIALPLNTHPGTRPADAEVKAEPGGTIGHRQRHGAHISASFGLALRKGV